MATEAQMRATAKYKKSHYHIINVFIPLDEDERIKSAAEAAGETLAKYFLNAGRARADGSNVQKMLPAGIDVKEGLFACTAPGCGELVDRTDNYCRGCGRKIEWK